MDGIELYYVYNAENGQSFLVNAPNGEEAIKVIAKRCGYDRNVLASQYVFIPNGESVSMDNITM